MAAVNDGYADDCTVLSGITRYDGSSVNALYKSNNLFPIRDIS